MAYGLFNTLNYVGSEWPGDRGRGGGFGGGGGGGGGSDDTEKNALQVLFTAMVGIPVLIVSAASIGAMMLAYPLVTKVVIGAVIKKLADEGDPYTPLYEIGLDKVTSKEVVDTLKNAIQLP